MVYKRIVLTQREILTELRRIGVKEPALLKEYLEDFKNYMKINYGLELATTKEESKEELRPEEIS